MNAGHRKTLKAIFTEPVSGSIKWRDVEALLLALGTEMSEGSGSRVSRPDPVPPSPAPVSRYETLGDQGHTRVSDECRDRIIMKSYKGYSGSIEFDDDDMVFHGRVLGLRDIVTFEAESAEELVKAFHDSVDDYLAFCKERGLEPQKPYSGKLALRTTPEIHALLSRAAASDGKSVNQWISDTLAEVARRKVDDATTRVTAASH